MRLAAAPSSLARPSGLVVPLPPRRSLIMRSTGNEQQSGVAVAPSAVEPEALRQPETFQQPNPYAMGQQATDGSNAMYTPPGYYYQAPRQTQDSQYYGQYQQAPPGYYMAAPPPPPAFKADESFAAPWWIWVGVGCVAASVFGKVQEFMKNPRSPQQMMAEMAMKQMMGGMNQGQGAGASPFGKPGQSPFPGGMPPGFPGGMPGTPFPGGMPPGMPPFPGGGFPQGFQQAATGNTVDIPGPSSAPSGEKFASRAADAQSEGSSKTEARSAPSTPSPSSASSVDVVEPIVKEPSSTSSTPRRSSSFFADVSTTTNTTASSGPSSSSSGPSANSTQEPSTSDSPATDGSGGAVMSEMMENMLRNPEMQKMLYPYLPEPMRNPSSIEWMLNNPEVKKQMGTLFEQQNMMSPQMMDMMKSMDFNQDKVNKQFEELGLKPEDVISKVMSNPELASGFSNPKVQAAIIDISANPMNIMKYQNDPEIMRVLEQVTSLFQPDVSPNQRS